MSRDISEKKRLLLEYKKKLVNRLQSCNQEIDAAKACNDRKTTFVESEDSDSDDDIHARYKQRLCPDTSELRSIYDQLRICLHATEELTELHVLESIVNILVEPPGFAKSLTDLEDGVWKEVCAECRVGFVCFSITFFTHQPNRKFSAATYHNLQVNVAKPLHEKELSNSILEDAVRPSDAVQQFRILFIQVLTIEKAKTITPKKAKLLILTPLANIVVKGNFHFPILDTPVSQFKQRALLHQNKLPVNIINAYAKAAKSRKQTLSAIAETYTEGEVYMKFLTDGGCLLKCHDVMELTWHLQNVRSPVAPFYHKMCFNLDYLGPEYMKDLNNAYKNIHDPNLTTERRTSLLLKIINICLEAKTQDSEVSDEIPQAVKNRRVTLDVEMNEHEILADRNKKKHQDTLAMAPPKSLPKKTKAKTPQKRPGSELNDVARKKVKHNSYKERSEHYFKDKDLSKQGNQEVNKTSKDDTESRKNAYENVDKNLNKKKPQESNNDNAKSSQIKNSNVQGTKCTNSKNNVVDENKKKPQPCIDKNTEDAKSLQVIKSNSQGIKNTNSLNNFIDENKKKRQEIIDKASKESKSTSTKKNIDITKKPQDSSDKNNDNAKSTQIKNTQGVKTVQTKSNADANKKKHIQTDKDIKKIKTTHNKESNDKKHKESQSKPQVVAKQTNSKNKEEANKQNMNENPKPVTDKVTKNSEVQNTKHKKVLQSKDAAKGSDVNNIKIDKQKVKEHNNKEKSMVPNNNENNKNKELQKTSNKQISKNINVAKLKNNVESSNKNKVKQTNDLAQKETSKNKDSTIILRENFDKNIQKSNQIKSIAPVLKDKKSINNIKDKQRIPLNNKINQAKNTEKISKIPLMKGVSSKLHGHIRTSPRITSPVNNPSTIIKKKLLTTPQRSIQKSLTSKNSITSKLKSIFSLQKK